MQTEQKHQLNVYGTTHIGVSVGKKGQKYNQKYSCWF